MPDVAEDEAPRFQLSLVQVIAGALAAITSAVILSKFGVAGTYVGTAIGSVVSTVAVAIYAHTMRRVRSQVRQYRHDHHRQESGGGPDHSRPEARPLRGAAAGWYRSHPRMAPAPLSNALKSGQEARLERWERWFAGLPTWGKVGVTAAAIFVLALSAIVVFQFVSGHSLTTIWGIGGSSNGPDVRCVVGRCGGGPPAVSTPSVTPRPSIQPTLAPTARPSVTATPLPSSMPTVQPTPTATPTPTPTPPTPTPTPVPVAAASSLPTPSP